MNFELNLKIKNEKFVDLEPLRLEAGLDELRRRILLRVQQAAEASVDDLDDVLRQLYRRNRPRRVGGVR